MAEAHILLERNRLAGKGVPAPDQADVAVDAQHRKVQTPRLGLLQPNGDDGIDCAARHLIDRRQGGWRPQLTDELAIPAKGFFVGKPDIYHALQACLIPLYPADGSVTRGILAAARPANC